MTRGTLTEAKLAGISCTHKLSSRAVVSSLKKVIFLYNYDTIPLLRIAALGWFIDPNTSLQVILIHFHSTSNPRIHILLSIVLAEHL
jgi:hypothetical protein